MAWVQNTRALTACQMLCQALFYLQRCAPYGRVCSSQKSQVWRLNHPPLFSSPISMLKLSAVIGTFILGLAIALPAHACTMAEARAMLRMKPISSSKSSSKKSIPSPAPVSQERSPMQKNLDLWRTWGEQLTAQAKELAHQKNGGGCIRILHDLETTFVIRYNEYVAISNDPLLRSQQRPNGSAQQIEEAMLRWKMDFDRAPSVCY